MAIEFRPRGLEYIVTEPRMFKRIQNRDGYALVDHPDHSIGLAFEGSLLAVSNIARRYSTQDPAYTVVVVENSCSSVCDGLPASLGRGRKVFVLP